eukprot:13821-Heterococcus_DN1.PRE.1
MTACSCLAYIRSTVVVYALLMLDAANIKQSRDTVIYADYMLYRALTILHVYYQYHTVHCTWPSSAAQGAAPRACLSCAASLLSRSCFCSISIAVAAALRLSAAKLSAAALRGCSDCEPLPPAATAATTAAGACASRSAAS